MFKSDPAVLRLCVKLHENLVEAMSQSVGVNDFTTQVFFQPVPKFFGDIGKEKGGNMLGLDSLNSNAILFVVGAGLTTEEPALAIAHERLGRMAAQIKQYAASIGADLPFLYLNYADESQNALGSYPKENVQHMLDMAAKYDPDAVFQKRIPGGFKISRV